LEKALEANKRTLDEEHLDTLASMHNLALNYSKVGRRQEGLQLSKEVMKADKRTLGEKHPDTLASMHALAFSYGEEHLDTLASIHNLTTRCAQQRGMHILVVQTLLAIYLFYQGSELILIDIRNPYRSSTYLVQYSWPLSS
jgi:hypothetical protein